MIPSSWVADNASRGRGNNALATRTMSSAVLFLCEDPDVYWGMAGDSDPKSPQMKGWSGRWGTGPPLPSHILLVPSIDTGTSGNLGRAPREPSGSRARDVFVGLTKGVLHDWWGCPLIRLSWAQRAFLGIQRGMREHTCWVSAQNPWPIRGIGHGLIILLWCWSKGLSTPMLCIHQMAYGRLIIATPLRWIWAPGYRGLQPGTNLRKANSTPLALNLV
jgi:hypothetical protein